jgi:hypothetical protein
MRFLDEYRPSEDARRACGAIIAGALLGVGLLMPAYTAQAEPVSVINALRTEGCGGSAAVGTRVRPHSALDDVARELSRRRRLEDAVDRVGYPAASSTSFRVRGSREDDVIRRMLADRYCAAVGDPRYEDIGVFQSGDDTWIVLAVRESALLPTLEPGPVAARVLALVNAARAEPRRCGRERYEAAPPLTLSTLLNEAASAHAGDMAARGSMSHRGSDGSLAGERITRSSYRWRAAGENVAAGQRDADTAVAAWLESPGHCATLMGPHFTEMGVAFALAPSKNPAIYWAQVFAAPQ